VLASQGRWDEAIEQYKLAQQLMPDSDRIHYKLGQALKEQKQFNAAMIEFHETLRLNPGHEGARQQLRTLEGFPPGSDQP
jgi:tetratricopeptide (TPR) repeat protein